MEIEYFVHPEKQNECAFIDDVIDHEMNVYSAEMQGHGKKHEKCQSRMLV